MHIIFSFVCLISNRSIHPFSSHIIMVLTTLFFEFLDIYITYNSIIPFTQEIDNPLMKVFSFLTYTYTLICIEFLIHLYFFFT